MGLLAFPDRGTPNFSTVFGDGVGRRSFLAFGNASVGRTRTARTPSPASSGEAASRQ